jgi:ABC-2 type transport system ATP-binding protein
MIERFELNTKKKYKKLSFGMKTMLTTIITLANQSTNLALKDEVGCLGKESVSGYIPTVCTPRRQSKIILLDEPTLGFDAIMRDQFNTLLLESYQAHPRIIIVSTHLIDEIAKVAERLIIIDKGRILFEAGIDDIDEKAYTISGSTNVVLPLLDGLNCIGKTTAGSVMAAHIYGERITPPDGVAIDRLSLQDFFINMVGSRNNEK